MAHDVFRVCSCGSMFKYFIPFKCWKIFHCRDISYFIHQWKDIWVVSNFFFWLLWIILLWTPVNKVLCGLVFSTLLDVYLGAELLGHMLVLCLTFWGTARMFSKGATPFYIPTVMYEFSNFLIYFLAILVKFCLFYSKHLSGEVTCLPHHG